MTNETTSKGAKPTYRLYIVQGEGDAAIWREVGACWPNKDCKGFNLDLIAVPVTGRLVMRVIEPKAETEDAA